MKAFWNPAGVEPIHWKLEHIDPASRVSGTNQERSLFQSEWYKSKKRRDTGSKTRHQEASWAASLCFGIHIVIYKSFQ